MSLLIGILSGFFYSFLAIGAMVLVMRYVLIEDVAAGVAAGIGVSLAQMVWAVIACAALSLSHFHLLVGKQVDSVQGYDASFAMLSVLILGFMAYRILRNPVPTAEQLGDLKRGRAFLVLLLVSITRPIRILGYVALFSLLGAHRIRGDLLGGGMLVIGVGLGSFIWWWIYSAMVGQLRHKMTHQHIKRVSQVGAILLILLAIVSLVSLFA